MSCNVGLWCDSDLPEWTIKSLERHLFIVCPLVFMHLCIKIIMFHSDAHTQTQTDIRSDCLHEWIYRTHTYIRSTQSSSTCVRSGECVKKLRKCSGRALKGDSVDEKIFSGSDEDRTIFSYPPWKRKSIFDPSWCCSIHLYGGWSSISTHIHRILLTICRVWIEE